jgi:hypothetical protein
MNEDVAEDFQCLGIEPDAGFLNMERAYYQMRSLYGEDSLATYSLLDEEARIARLERIETSYRRLSEFYRISKISGPELKDQDDDPSHPADSPGRYLRQLREKANLSRRDMAERTKISPMRLGHLEEERFDLLPAPVYLRGFVLAYAKVLKLPQSDEIVALYLARREERTDSENT